MQCTRCGEELLPGVQRCGACGAAALPPPPSSARPVSFPYDRRASRWPTVAKLLGVAVALAVIGVAIAPLVTDVSGEVATTAGPPEGPDPADPAATAAPGSDDTLPPITPETSATVASIAPTDTAAGAPAAGNVPGVTVVASCTARGSTDSRGNAIDFKPENTLDADPATAWRCGGDGSGVSLTYTFPAPTALALVGAVPGFAADDPFNQTDRFLQNRRVAAGTWTCLDAASTELASVDQRFEDARTLQTVPAVGFDACVTVRFEITASTQSGGRDFVAMSDVGLVGKT